MGHGHRAQFAPDEGGAEHCTNLFLMVPFLCLYGVLVAVINLICDDDGMILFEILSLLHSSFGPDQEKTRLTALNAPRPCDNSHCANSNTVGFGEVLVKSAEGRFLAE